jgi:tRNA (cytidine/uridine-2'-O-)-methyltransferase
MQYNVVLYQPENPHNTGAIVRTCALLGASLHLIKPYGFAGLDGDVQRSSMSYLGQGPINEYDSWHIFAASLVPGARVFALWDGGEQSFNDIAYRADDYFVFGRESVGLPSEVIDACRTLRIPMPGVHGDRTDHRDHSLNLSVSVAMTLAVAIHAAQTPSTSS